MKHHLVTFGELMLRLSTPGHERFGQARSFGATYGGAEANVAAALAQWGVPTQFISALPNHDLGRAAARFLHQYGVGTRHLLYQGERLGMYFLEAGALGRGSQVIYDRVHSAFAELTPGIIDWEKALLGTTWLHWSGITPAISAQAAAVCAEALAAARQLGLRISTDLNYRAKLWQYGQAPTEVMPDLVQHCEVIVGNPEALGTMLGLDLPGLDLQSDDLEAEDYTRMGQAILEAYPKAKTLALSLRRTRQAQHHTLAGVLWDGQQLHTTPTQDLPGIVDRVGGGDAFMAGLLYGLMDQPKQPDRALALALAASCLKHSISGDILHCQLEEVLAYLQNSGSARVAR